MQTFLFTYNLCIKLPGNNIAEELPSTSQPVENRATCRWSSG